MKKSKFSPSQIVKNLKEYESGNSCSDLCRTYGMSPATLYNWKKKYNGMDSTDLKKMKALEMEN